MMKKKAMMAGLSNLSFHQIGKQLKDLMQLN